MKQILVIGSTVVDVVINLHRLPTTGEDVHVLKQSMSLGGCAYNTADIIRRLDVPHTLFSPVGTGVYGEYVRKRLEETGIVSPIPAPDMDNGCCYCIVEHTGERTFICDHGAEYLFQPEWFSLLDVPSISSVYLCGLEVEETTGPVIIDWLEQNRGPSLYFAPGPRIQLIAKDRMERLLALSPILHLNETEALGYTGQPSVEEAAARLSSKTHNTVIVTLGHRGSYCHADSFRGFVAPVTAVQVDTIGAGDAHIGAVMALRERGLSWEEAIEKANRVAAAVVGVEGARLPDSWFEQNPWLATIRR